MDMKKIRILLLGLLLMPVVCAMAITDQQVIQSALSLYQQGKSEQEIAQQLLRNGASLEQLQRVSRQVNMLQQTSAQQASVSGAQPSSQRKNNGETTPATNDQALQLVQQMFGEPMPEKQEKLKVFGQDIFRTPDAQFQPNMNQATPKNYTLGAGDEVIIDIYGASQLNVRGTISPDGTVTIDGYGPVTLGGLTIIEATRRLKNTVGKRYQGSQIM